MIKLVCTLAFIGVLISCKKQIPVSDNAIKPIVITQPTPHDTDDPAIWIHPDDPSKSLIIGTDKEVGGGLYLYDLDGKIVSKHTNMLRPNNVDVAYGFMLNGKKIDIVVATERKANKIRVLSLPDFQFIDNGGIEVFVGETGIEERDPMGIALYTRQIDSIHTEIHAVVGRKTGPSGSYLWQYLLTDNGSGNVTGEVVRKFGNFSGKAEIEAIAVDNELGHIYYSDETAGVRKYYANPEKGNAELAFFAQNDALEDHEGIAIYKKDDKTGYILVSNQQNNSFLVYPREGSTDNPHEHLLIVDIPVSTIECDGADATSVNLGNNFPNGIFVAMSNGNVFHIYDWNSVQERIDSSISK